jgi:uncharacterized phage-associated protein
MRKKLYGVCAVDLVLGCYGEMSGLALINQTHRELPWKETYRPGLPSNIIPLDLMYTFYKENIDFTEE